MLYIAMQYCMVATAVVTAVFSVMVYRLQRRQPEKSLKFCTLQLVLQPLRTLRIGPFKNLITLENSMKSAAKVTGFADFGDLTFAETYKAVMESSTQKKQVYQTLGWISAQKELELTMARRLKLIQFCKRYPAFLKIPVRTPVFVMGLPRTGTTFLHRLLSLDPVMRAPLLWELLEPTPRFIPDSTTDAKMIEKDKAERADFVRSLISTRESLGDSALKHIHEIGYDLPEECIFGLAAEIPCLPQFFYSAYMGTGDESLLHIMAGNAVVDAYKLYKKQLQLLSFQEGEGMEDDCPAPRRWVLKCPMHLFYIKELAQAFPDAKVIWTHRHPVSAVPSLCSLLKSFHQVYYAPHCRDDALLGKTIASVSAEYLTKAPQDLQESGLEHTNVTYEALIKDPISVVQQIYADFEWTFSDEYQVILQSYIAKDKAKRQALKERQGSKEVHSYAPEEFSLTAAELSSGKFVDYCKKFDVPFPKK